MPLDKDPRWSRLNSLRVDERTFAKIIKLNCSSGSYEEWKAKRKFIADCIDADGSILDIGCASGLLLCSLQAWTTYTLKPFGIDTNPHFISNAQALFQDIPQHFALHDVHNAATISAKGLPEKYTFVFWNCFAEWDLTNPYWRSKVREISSITKKRLILAFYGTNSYPLGTAQWAQEREAISDRVHSISRILNVSGLAMNPTGYNQAIAWIDSNPH